MLVHGTVGSPAGSLPFVTATTAPAALRSLGLQARGAGEDRKHGLCGRSAPSGIAQRGCRDRPRQVPNRTRLSALEERGKHLGEVCRRRARRVSCPQPHLAHFATLRASGTPHVVPVWVLWEEGRAYVMTDTGSVKMRNIRRNPAVSVCVSTSDQTLLLRDRGGKPPPPARRV